MRVLHLALSLAVATSAAWAQEAPPALAKKEAEARAFVAEELARLSRFCVQAHAYAAARAELQRGLLADPRSAKLAAALKAVPERRPSPRPDFAPRFAEERERTYRRCAERWASLLDLCAEEDLAPQRERYAAQLRRFAGESVYRDLGWAYFAPYLAWVSPADLERLNAGEEHIDGRWRRAEDVARLNELHSDWSAPWTLSDEAHELQTTLPYRSARQILAHIGSFREFFLAQFIDTWDLRAPAGKLPVIVTTTQAEFRAWVERAAGTGDRYESLVTDRTGTPAALYLYANRSLNPCLVTFEPMDATGRIHKASLEYVLLMLRHELTHQIAFEYSKYDYDASRVPTFHYWASEGLANYMAYHRLEEGRWRPWRPSRVESNGMYSETPFGFVRRRRGELPALDDFMSIPREKFHTVENYCVATSLTHFLLEGESGRYRRPFIRLLEAQHKARDAADGFRDAFGGLGPQQLQKPWREYLEELARDDR